MTKKELAREMAKKGCFDPEFMEIAVNLFMEVATETLSKGESIYLRRFGCFSSRKRKQKTGQDMNKKTSVVIPAKNVPHFKAYDELKNRVGKK